MLLAIDIGNSNVVFGLFKDDVMLATYRLEADQARTEDEFASLLINCLSISGYNYKSINGVIISSTKQSLNPLLEKLSQKYFNITPLIVGPKLKTGIKIKIDEPKSLGADLLVGAVASQAKYGGNCLIIDMGTATSFTIVTEDKEFIGGCIYPGLKTSSSALSSKTSALPHINFEIPVQIVNKDTVKALQAGLMYGYAYMLDGLVKNIKKEFDKPLKVILTGGLALKIIDLIDFDCTYDENLLLDGLRILYHRNISRTI